MQVYGNCSGISLVIVHCLGWCPIMTPVFIASFHHVESDVFVT